MFSNGSEHPSNSDDLDRAGGVKSVGRALDLLEALSADELGLVELGRRTGLQPSTVHRMLATLKARNYVERDPRSGRYRLGDRAEQLGWPRSIVSRPLNVFVWPFVQRLARVSKSTVHLSVLDGPDVLFAGQLFVPDPQMRAVPPGTRLPAHASASGKAILAHDERSRNSIVERLVTRCTPNTIVGKREFIAELEAVRERGFSIDREEYKVGVTCVACPIFDAAGRVVGAMSVSGPTRRISAELFDLGELVARTTTEASQALGYAGKCRWDLALR